MACGNPTLARVAASNCMIRIPMNRFTHGVQKGAEHFLPAQFNHQT